MNSQQVYLLADKYKQEIRKYKKQYEEKHGKDFDKRKRDRYINRKMKKNTEMMISFFLSPALKKLRDSETLK